MPLMILSVSHDADVSVNNHHMTPMPMVSHDQTIHVAPHCHHLDLTNGMVPWTTLLASCDIDISIYGITWPKRLFCTLFQSSWPNKCSGAVDNAIHIAWCWCQCQQYQMIEKRSCCISFWSSWTKKCNDAIQCHVMP